MKILKFSLIIFFQLFIVACGGGGGAVEGETQYSEITTPSYFEDITNRNNCAIDAVNKALGEIFIPRGAYEKYMMLIYAAENDKVSNDSKQSKDAKARALKCPYITEKQYQAFLKFHKSTKSEEAKLAELEKEFNESRLEDPSRMNFQEYKEHHGILGEFKEVMRVIGIVNAVYKLELPLAKFNENKSSDFKGYESLIMHQANHFFALSKKNGDQLDSESQAPEILSSTDLTDRLGEMIGNSESVVSIVGFDLAEIQQAKKAFNANPSAFEKLFAAVLQDPS